MCMGKDTKLSQPSQLNGCVLEQRSPPFLPSHISLELGTPHLISNYSVHVLHCTYNILITCVFSPNHRNDQESVHIDGGASDVEDEKPMIGAELASEKKGVLAFSTSPDTSGTVTTSYRPLGEELAAFSNPMGLDDSQPLVQSSAMDTTCAVVDERPKAAQFKETEKPPPDYESVKQSREENPYVLDPMHKN